MRIACFVDDESAIGINCSIPELVLFRAAYFAFMPNIRVAGGTQLIHAYKATTMKAYFMRHGQTNYNVLRLCNDVPTRSVYLTEKGISQAEEVAQRLIGVKFDRIIVSELPRTRQTADIVNRHHGVTVTVHPGINDFRTGLDGESVSKLYETIAPNPMNTRIADGETLTEHKQRVLGFLDWLRQQDERVVLVVAHEETLRVVTAHFRRLPDEAMLALKFDNTEILEFQL